LTVIALKPAFVPCRLWRGESASAVLSHAKGARLMRALVSDGEQ